MFFQFVVILAVLAILCNGLSLSMKQFSRAEVLKPFQAGNALKIISGLNNFDKTLVKNVAFASTHGGASHIDIACDADLVKIAKDEAFDLPICVSSVKPEAFVSAVNAGADMIEIGNFDSFYDQNIAFSEEDIIRLTKETRALLPSVVLSVTVPHTLSLPRQIALAQELEALGADIIQTEGKVSANVAGMGVQELIEMSAPTLAATYAISRAVKIPVMCASGLTDITAPLALAAGAKGVGIGSMVNKLSSKQQMLMAVSWIAASMGRVKEIKSEDIDSVNDVAKPVTVRQNVQF